MVPTETPYIKGTGSSTEQKPATIVYHPPDGRDPQVGAATHHIVTSDGEVHVYLGDRREGIDSTLPLNRCEIHRSDKGRETFGADVDASVGDGSGSGEDGDSGAHPGSEDPEIVTDGGRDIPPCRRCGADLIESVEMGTAKVGLRRDDWSVRLKPTATCECGASVAADVVQSLVDELGDPLDDDGVSVEVEDERTASMPRSRDDHQKMIDVTVGDMAVVGSGKGVTVKAVRTDPVEIDVARLGWSATITGGWWKCDRCGRLSVEPSRGRSARTCSVCIQEREAEAAELRREDHERELRDALMKDPSEVMMRSCYDRSDDGVNGGDE